MNFSQHRPAPPLDGFVEAFWYYAAAGLFLSISAILACLLPARRAVKIDPMVALRRE